MEYGFIQEYCLSKKGAEEDYKQEWDAIRYSVRGKMFALVGNDAEGKYRPVNLDTFCVAVNNFSVFLSLNHQSSKQCPAV